MRRSEAKRTVAERPGAEAVPVVGLSLDRTAMTSMNIAVMNDAPVISPRYIGSL
jgi:hypothetical protein